MMKMLEADEMVETDAGYGVVGKGVGNDGIIRSKNDFMSKEERWEKSDLRARLWIQENVLFKWHADIGWTATKQDGTPGRGSSACQSLAIASRRLRSSSWSILVENLRTTHSAS
jgi:hypothetical protein